MAEAGWRKGPWVADEDNKLIEHVKLHGEGRWSSVSTISGLNRNGKSCRLRWINYLRPGLKRGDITPHEEGIIIELHALWGNKWSTIARYLPGRTDNEIKNYWRTHFKKERKPLDKQERKRSQQWQALQLRKQKEFIVISKKTVKAVEDKLINVSFSLPEPEVIDNQNMNTEPEVGALKPESSTYDLLRYPSMDFQYYLPPTNMHQNDESDDDSTIPIYGLWEACGM